MSLLGCSCVPPSARHCSSFGLSSRSDSSDVCKHCSSHPPAASPSATRKRRCCCPRFPPRHLPAPGSYFWFQSAGLRDLNRPDHVSRTCELKFRQLLLCAWACFFDFRIESGLRNITFAFLVFLTESCRMTPHPAVVTLSLEFALSFRSLSFTLARTLQFLKTCSFSLSFSLQVYCIIALSLSCLLNI